MENAYHINVAAKKYAILYNLKYNDNLPYINK